MPLSDPSHRHSPHRKRYDHLNHARFLTCSCFRRKPLLQSQRASTWLIEAIERARETHKFHLWAYVIMPEHFHLLLFPDPATGTVSPILKSIKQSVTRRALLALRNERRDPPKWMRDERPDGHIITRFWQRGGGYDRNLWSADHIWETIDYIHMNPVARNLCAAPLDWPWSSAGNFANHGTGPLSIDKAHIPPKP